MILGIMIGLGMILGSWLHSATERGREIEVELGRGGRGALEPN